MIEFNQLKCPSCGADLKVENGLDTFYCQYCGTKIMLQGQSDTVINAKKEIKIEETKAEKELSMQKEKHRHEIEKKEYEDRQFWSDMKKFGIIIAVCFLLFFLMIIGSHITGYA